MKICTILQRQSIKTKMVLAFLSVSILSVLLSGVFSNLYYSRAAEKEFFNVSSEAINRLNYHLDYYYNQLQQSTLSLIQNDVVQDWLRSESDANADIQNVEKELRRYLALNYSEIQGMFLISKSHKAVSMTQSFAKPSLISGEPWIKLPLSPVIRIIPTHTAGYEGADGRQVISVLLPIFDKESLDLIGALMIDISLHELDQSFKSSQLGGSATLFILADDDRIVYHPDEAWNGLPKQQTGLAALQIPDHEMASLQHFQGADYLLASARSQVTGWRTVSLVRFDEMAVGISSARFSVILALGVITLLIVMIVPLLSNRFVNPILRLMSLMRQVGKGDLSVQTKSVPGQDELQQLFYSFNQMVQRLDELVASNTSLQFKEMQAELRQKQALIKALQNQINPHLLYNTLGIIKSIAYLEKVPAIERMARNLADVYRYTAYFSEMEVFLKDELEQLRKYLEIVHIRFPKHFQSQFFINEKFLQCRVVKLILQPIVENAVKYAIEQRGGEGAVIVSAYQDKEDLIIEVADNGPGIDETELHRIEGLLRQISAKLDQDYGDHDSLGIPNVHARLVLKYGGEYGVKITTFAGRGTVVSLRIPLYPEQYRTTG